MGYLMKKNNYIFLTILFLCSCGQNNEKKGKPTASTPRIPGLIVTANIVGKGYYKNELTEDKNDSLKVFYLDVNISNSGSDTIPITFRRRSFISQLIFQPKDIEDVLYVISGNSLEAVSLAYGQRLTFHCIIKSEQITQQILDSFKVGFIYADNADLLNFEERIDYKRKTGKDIYWSQNKHNIDSITTFSFTKYDYYWSYSDKDNKEIFKSYNKMREQP